MDLAQFGLHKKYNKNKNVVFWILNSRLFYSLYIFLVIQQGLK